MSASLASSTTYWIRGLSTMVSISFGIALVAGRTRVPRPATGKTALRIFMDDQDFQSERGRQDMLVAGLAPVKKPDVSITSRRRTTRFRWLSRSALHVELAKIT